MVRPVPHDRADRRRTGRRIRRQGRYRQMRRGSQRRNRHEVRRTQHPHHPLYPQRRGGRQAGRRRIEERPGGEDRSAVVR